MCRDILNISCLKQSKSAMGKKKDRPVWHARVLTFCKKIALFKAKRGVIISASVYFNIYIYCG